MTSQGDVVVELDDVLADPDVEVVVDLGMVVVVVVVLVVERERWWSWWTRMSGRRGTGGRGGRGRRRGPDVSVEWWWSSLVVVVEVVVEALMAPAHEVRLSRSEPLVEGSTAGRLRRVQIEQGPEPDEDHRPAAGSTAGWATAG